METTNTKKVIILVLAISISFVLGKYSQPEKVEIREVIKTVEVEKKQENKDVKVVKVKITKPDGTIIEREKLEDKTKSSSEVVKATDKRKEEIRTNKRDWLVSVGYGKTLNGLDFTGMNDSFSIGISHRVLGSPAFIGVDVIHSNPLNSNTFLIKLSGEF